MRFSPSKTTRHHETNIINYAALNGGLNTKTLDYELPTNQSGDMENLWWKDGVLQSRDGQKQVFPASFGHSRPYAMSARTFYGYTFFHDQGSINCYDLHKEQPTKITVMTGVPDNKGVFFQYLDWLFYKNEGGFYRIQYHGGVEGSSAAAPFTCVSMTGESTVTVKFDTGDGVQTTFDTLYSRGSGGLVRYDAVSLDFDIVSTDDYTADLNTGKITLNTAPSPAKTLNVVCIVEPADTPTIIINADPATGSGDLYQPENRLQAKKRITYNAWSDSSLYSQSQLAVSGERSYTFNVGSDTRTATIQQVAVNGVKYNVNSYTWVKSTDGNYILTFTGTPTAGSNIQVSYTLAQTGYKLPVKGADLVSLKVNGEDYTAPGSIVSFSEYLLAYDPHVSVAAFKAGAFDYFGAVVSVKDKYECNFSYGPQTWEIKKIAADGTPTTADRHPSTAQFREDFGVSLTTNYLYGAAQVTVEIVDPYTYDEENGVITFALGSEPPVTNPPTNNTVEVVYSKDNEDAMKSIMDCKYATTSGYGMNLCILLAGSTKQPNAIFWNSNDELSMNPGYWPMSYYNLAGETDEPVYGFGRQYGTLLVLKEHSVGKLEYGVEQVNGRNSISFTYSTVNPKFGCDLPGSIQQIENNLIFANSQYGVFMVSSTSFAIENNLTRIDEKLEPHLLPKLRAANRQMVCSYDDNDRYWLCLPETGEVYCWDYGISKYTDPSWFYLTGVTNIAYTRIAGDSYALGSDGRFVKFVDRKVDEVFVDGVLEADVIEERAIKKRYAFPPTWFGSYDRLKDVTRVIFALKGGVDSRTTITYKTDYETRKDLTDLFSASWHLVPLNLARWSLRPAFSMYEAIREPCTRHVRNFQIILENEVAHDDLAIVYVQVFYRFQGRDR